MSWTDNYSIKDLEQLSGIKAHTIRVWEQRYNLLSPQRTDTNIRFYDAADLKLLLNIAVLLDTGLRISRIAAMSRPEIADKVRTLTDQQTPHHAQLQTLTLTMIELDEERFEKIISTHILQYGLEAAMRQLIYPFLTHIGILWQTGAINPAHEHFITNLIRQKLIVAIDGQMRPNSPQAKTWVLFLPEGEMHELSLLFANYLIRSRRQRCVYLGQSLPLPDLAEIARVHNPDYILTIITSLPSVDSVQRYLHRLRDAVPGGQLLLTGYSVLAQPLELPPDTRLLTKIDELVALLDAQADHSQGREKLLQG